MRSVVVTGLGWATCLGHDRATVLEALKERRHGFTDTAFLGAPDSPVKVAAPIPGFQVNSPEPVDWTWPGRFKLDPARVRAYAPHVVYGHCALLDALAEAGLEPEHLRDGRTGLYCASAGSPMLMRQRGGKMAEGGWKRGHPMGVIGTVAGTLNFNLAAAFGIQGSVAGFVSACASSGHALGYAWDEIVLHRQDRMLVVAGEDLTAESLLPFTAMGALSLNPDPDQASRPFDTGRDGFVGTGGAVAMILEAEEVALLRGAHIQARLLGWGQAADGYHVATPQPEGQGLERAIRDALVAANLQPTDVDYINAHATSTPAGDRAEALALQRVFTSESWYPPISSTKGLTGHGLSMSSLLEASFCVLALDQAFIPGNAPSLQTPDPTCEGLNLPGESLVDLEPAAAPTVALNNSSGFGGSNVCTVFGVG